MSQNPFFEFHKRKLDSPVSTKSRMKMGAMEIMRANCIPYMTFGKPGDVIVVDNSDDQEYEGEYPTSIGWWIKLPMNSPAVPTGNTIHSFPNAFAKPGDILMINGVTIPLSPPYDITTVANDIFNASIPNIKVIILGDTISLTELSAGAITVTNVAGQPSRNLGLYSVKSHSDLIAEGFKINGKWAPLGLAAQARGPGSPIAASYLTVIPEGSLSDSRVITFGPGLKFTDSGPGGALQIDYDYDSLPASAAIEPASKVAIRNPVTSQMETVTVQDLIDSGLFIANTNKVLNKTIGTSPATMLGDPLNTGEILRKVVVAIETPYPSGTSIIVGTPSNPDLFVKATEVDPTKAGIYEISLNYTITISEAPQVSVLGNPASGQSSVFLEFL